MNCNGHRPYASRVAAAQAMVELIADAKRTGRGGKSFKRLTVWPCGNHFHVGRRNKLPKAYKPAPSKEKPLTAGQALRALRRLDEQYNRMQDHFARKRAEYIGRLIEADRAAGWLS